MSMAIKRNNTKLQKLFLQNRTPQKFCGSDVRGTEQNREAQSPGRNCNKGLPSGELNWWQPQWELFTTVLQRRQGLIVWL